MKKLYKKFIALFLSFTMAAGLCACTKTSENTEVADNSVNENTEQTDNSVDENTEQTDSSVDEYIKQTLNLANNEEQEWTYSSDADAWILSVVTAVAYPELPGQQGVSVCVPGAYVIGIDIDGDGMADVTAENVTDAVKGALVIDYEAKITSTNGKVYTASTAPVVLNTGAAGYGS